MSDGVSVDKGSTVVSAGAVDVVMSYRNDIPGDAGLCIQIYAEVDGQDTELLRFDCFANAPARSGNAARDCGWRSARLGAGAL